MKDGELSGEIDIFKRLRAENAISRAFTSSVGDVGTHFVIY
jgi:hypothetical protein